MVDERDQKPIALVGDVVAVDDFLHLGSIIAGSLRKPVDTFHHRCVRIILGISNKQQWSECFTVEVIWGSMRRQQLKR